MEPPGYGVRAQPRLSPIRASGWRLSFEKVARRRSAVPGWFCGKLTVSPGAMGCQIRFCSPSVAPLLTW